MSYGTNVGDFQEATAQWQKLMVDSWSQWTKTTVASDSFSTASGAYMDWTLSTQKMMTEMSGQVMQSLDIPRRSDLARLSAQVQAVESRLLDQEESNDEMRDLLLALHTKLDKIAATSTVGAATTKSEVSEGPKGSGKTSTSQAKKSSKKNAPKT